MHLATDSSKRVEECGTEDNEQIPRYLFQVVEELRTLLKTKWSVLYATHIEMDVSGLEGPGVQGVLRETMNSQ